MTTKILKVGFEIEGEFSHELMNELLAYGSIHVDSTVRKCEDVADWKMGSERDTRCSYSLIPNEFSSNPYVPTSRNIDKIFKLFNEHPYHWNYSAGMHVHLSFEPRIPVELWSMEFYKQFHKLLAQQYPHIPSLRFKGNDYCRVLRTEEDIARKRSHYNSINFLDALLEHKTVEFRVFPSDNPMRMREYLEFTITNVKNFIAEANTGKLKKRLVAHLEDKNPLEFTEVSSDEHSKSYTGVSRMPFSTKEFTL